MAQTTSLGFTVWNLSTDPYDHIQLAANWTLANTLFSTAGKAIQSVSNLNAGTGGGPQSPLNNGDLVMTNTTVSTFPAWTLLRWDATRWEAIGPLEVQGALPGSNNYAGRLVLLSSAAGNFKQWEVVRYDGTNWDYVGPFAVVNTGAGATNIVGAKINGDVYINSGSRGLVLTDRTTTTKYRLYIDNGDVRIEVVT